MSEPTELSEADKQQKAEAFMASTDFANTVNCFAQEVAFCRDPLARLLKTGAFAFKRWRRRQE